MKLFFLIFLSFLIIIMLGSFGVKTYMENRFSNRIFDLNSMTDTSASVAIVFGAGVRENNEPSAVLYDRVWTAVELYKKGYVKKLLFTGDNSTIDYNEPEVMQATAIKLGVASKDIILDYAGRRTYDSCYRSVLIFGIKKAVLVSQAFHLPRCLYFCENFNIDAISVVADRQTYPKFSQVKWIVREAIATLRAWYNINIKSPSVILGENENIC